MIIVIIYYLTYTTLIYLTSSQNVRVEIGGQYFGEESDGDIGINRIMNALKTISNGTLNLDTAFLYKDWMASMVNYDDGNDIQHIIDYYKDIDGVNNDINKEIMKSEYNSSIISYGNIIFCDNNDEPLCSKENKIGPFNHYLLEYGPIDININFDINNIISRDDVFSSHLIQLFILLSTIWTNSDESPFNEDFVASQLFPNSNGAEWTSITSNHESNQSDKLINSEYILYTPKYHDLTGLYLDTGLPQNWSNKYSNFYYSTDDNNGLLYLYGINAICSNDEILALYLNGDTMIEPTEPTTSSEGDEESEVNQGNISIILLFILHIYLFTII